MIRKIAEWSWRVAMLAALLWVGWELRQFHADYMQPVDDGSTVTAGADELQTSIDDLRDDVATLDQKLDAIALALATGKR